VLFFLSDAGATRAEPKNPSQIPVTQVTKIWLWGKGFMIFEKQKPSHETPMKTLLFLILGALGFTSIAGCQEKAPLPDLNQALVLDVRSPEEYAQGHLQQAQNIPHDQIAMQIAQIAPDKNQEIVLYCRSGRRSGIALQTLQDLGYTKVVNGGAYDDLKSH
jgi:phage shock protein E